MHVRSPLLILLLAVTSRVRVPILFAVVACQAMAVTRPPAPARALLLSLSTETAGCGSSDRRILPARHSEAEASRGPLRVLAIGVGRYASRRLPLLHFAGADARDLAQALQAQAGKHKLYTTASVTVLTDSQATLAAVRQALAAFTRDVQPGETLVLVLSGHGLKDAAGQRFYFAPTDLDPENMAETGLPWEELLSQLEGARQQARAVWVLADCCRAAPALSRDPRQGPDPEATSRDLLRDAGSAGNLMICTASSGDRPSYESEDLKHGLFTQVWLEALRGDVGKQFEALYEERSRTRVLTLAGLQSILSLRMRWYARQEGVRQEIEFPRLEGSLSTDQPIFVPVPASSP